MVPKTMAIIATRIDATNATENRTKRTEAVVTKTVPMAKPIDLEPYLYNGNPPIGIAIQITLQSIIIPAMTLNATGRS